MVTCTGWGQLLAFRVINMLQPQLFRINISEAGEIGRQANSVRTDLENFFHPSKFAENLFHVSSSSFPSFEKKIVRLFWKSWLHGKFYIIPRNCSLIFPAYDYIRLLEIKTLELAPVSLQPSFNFLELSSIIVR